jgi:hypothetical protein
LLNSGWKVNHPFVQCIPTVFTTCLFSHLTTISVIRLTVIVFQCLCPTNPHLKHNTLPNKGPKVQE